MVCGPFGGIYPYPFSPPLHRLSFSKEGRGRERKWCWSTRKQPGSWFLLLCNVRGSNRGEKTTFLFSACPRFEPGTARIVHEAQPSRPGCHIFLAHNLTDHKRMVSTMVCGPFGGIYPYPSHPPCIDCPFSKEDRGRERKKWCWSTRKQPGSWLCCCVMSWVRTEEKRQHFCFWHVRGSNQGLLELCTRLCQVDQDAIFLAHNLTGHKRMVSTMVCGPFGGIYPYPSQVKACYRFIFCLPVRCPAKEYPYRYPVR